MGLKLKDLLTKENIGTEFLWFGIREEVSGAKTIIKDKYNNITFVYSSGEIVEQDKLNKLLYKDVMLMPSLEERFEGMQEPYSVVNSADEFMLSVEPSYISLAAMNKCKDTALTVDISTKKDDVVIGLMEISFADWDRLNDRVQNIKRLVNTYKIKTNIKNN